MLFNILFSLGVLVVLVIGILVLYGFEPVLITRAIAADMGGMAVGAVIAAGLEPNQE